MAARPSDRSLPWRVGCLLSAPAVRSILLVAVWHTAFNFTSATPAAAGSVAAITSTLVMVAAVVIITADWRRHHPARR